MKYEEQQEARQRLAGKAVGAGEELLKLGQIRRRVAADQREAELALGGEVVEERRPADGPSACGHGTLDTNQSV